MSRRVFKTEDLIGMKFGRLTIVKELEKKKYGKNSTKRIVVASCECGSNDKEYILEKLLQGKTKSCGCLIKENSKNMMSNMNFKHGMSKTRFYKIYQSMKERCYKKNHIHYSDYGGRGIKVCDYWMNNDNGFINFKNDMYQSYCSHVDLFGENDTSIDRIDTSGDYCFENCRWSTCLEQQKNRRNSIVVDYHGEKYSISELSNISGIKRGTLESRIRKCLSEDDLLRPVDERKSYANKIMQTNRKEAGETSE